MISRNLEFTEIIIDTVSGRQYLSSVVKTMSREKVWDFEKIKPRAEILKGEN